MFDIIVIGGGPGGTHAALEAVANGLSCALIESDKIGGTCLNRGCIPTKAMLHATGLYREALDAEKYGVELGAVGINDEKLFSYRNSTVAALRDGLAASLKKAKIQVIFGSGKIIEIDGGFKVAVGDEIIESKNVILASGSRVSIPPIPGIDCKKVVTSDDLLEKDCLPESLVIIGGGVIGCEFACIYANTGKKATVIEALPRILANMDKDISRNLTMLLKKRGVEVIADASVTEIKENEDDKIGVTYSFKGQSQTVTADFCLCAVGRRANTEKLFAGGINTPEMYRGRIVTDENGMTDIPGLYAIGDITNGAQLAHSAQAQGENAAAHIAGKLPLYDISLIPACVYTQPEIACVGMTEEQAKANNIEIKTARAIMGANAKSTITQSDRGFIKLICNAENDELIGAQLMCDRATDIISEMTLAISQHQTSKQLLAAVRPHPTYEEVLTDALKQL